MAKELVKPAAMVIAELSRVWKEKAQFKLPTRIPEGDA
jgi:hypothetical protein